MYEECIVLWYTLIQMSLKLQTVIRIIRNLNVIECYYDLRYFLHSSSIFRSMHLTPDLGIFILRAYAICGRSRLVLGILIPFLFARTGLTIVSTPKIT